MSGRAPAALGAACLAVAAWWWAGTAARPPAEPGDDCEDAAACMVDPPAAHLDPPGSGPDDAPSAEAPPPADADAGGQGGSEDAAAPAPVPPEEAARLRAEADRLLAEGRFVEGVEAMRRATEADPSARNHGDLGALLEKGTAFRDAVVHLKRAAQLDPGNADRWIALANAYYRLVDLGGAWDAENRARAAEPGLVLGRDAGGMRVRKGDSRDVSK